MDHDARAIALLRRDVASWRAVVRAALDALHAAHQREAHQARTIAELKDEIRARIDTADWEDE